ncbi:MAG: GvpL/GvpF family gas vesicle protein, partial [Nitrososphaerales archaeon]
MTSEGRYLYCVIEAPEVNAGNIGISGKEVNGVVYKDVTAVVSAIPFKA